MQVHELRDGLWRWTGLHPDWTPDDGGPEGWEQDVRSYALDAGDSLVLFDPMSPPAEITALATGRPVVVLLTVKEHQRSALDLAVSFGATVYAPAAKVGDVDAPALPFGVGDVLPGDVEAHPAAYEEEAIFWIPKHRALVTGDAFLGGERGFRVLPDSWLPEGLSPDALRERLRPLLHLPVELLLPTHGDPIADDARATLQRALET